MVGQISRLAFLLLPLGVLASCGEPMVAGPNGTPSGAGAAKAEATATLSAMTGTNAAGMVTFTQTDKGVAIVASFTGLTPGKHGLHLHEKGVCTAPDFASAGEHFNPNHEPHACPPTENRHAGDLGNLEIGPDGTGRLELTTDLLTLGSGPTSAIGRSVILHDMPDDCTTQPTGGSGARLGCGVVRLK
jgi:Cu-Zn family superoxide dismutase